MLGLCTAVVCADCMLCYCSKDARSKDVTASDKLKAAKAGDQDANKLEEEAAKLAERSRAAQEKADRAEKEAHNVRTGLSGIQGDAKSKRQAAERLVHRLTLLLLFCHCTAT